MQSIMGVPQLIEMPTHSTLSRNQMNIKKHEKYYHSIIVGTIGGHNPLCLKSNKIRYLMISKNQRLWRHKAENKEVCLDFGDFS